MRTVTRKMLDNNLISIDSGKLTYECIYSGINNKQLNH